jgi:hypothetical protein
MYYVLKHAGERPAQPFRVPHCTARECLFPPAIGLQHDIEVNGQPARSGRYDGFGSGHFLELDPLVISSIREVLRDDDVALALVILRQPFEIAEPQFDRVYRRRPNFQTLQADEQSGSRQSVQYS